MNFCSISFNCVSSTRSSLPETNKRKGLPQWLKDALDKKEKEKQKKLDKEKGKKTKDDGDDATGSSSLVTNATPTKKVCQIYFIIHAVECRNLQLQSESPWRPLTTSLPRYF